MEHQPLAKANAQPEAQSSVRSALSPDESIHPLLRQQQLIGNRAVGRQLQAKLKVSQPGDMHEQEADRVADQVMRTTDPETTSTTAVASPGQHACTDCEEEEEAHFDHGEVEPSHAAAPTNAAGVVSVKTSLRPHENSPATLRQEADIYAQGKTPVRVGGELQVWDAKPLGAVETGAHLHEIERQFGPHSVEQSVRGLAQTRGEAFARSVAEGAGFSPTGRSLEGGTIGQDAMGAIRASNPSGSMPDTAREKLTNASGYDFDGIAIHNDAAAHQAADQLNARAFTVGRNIYFARDEYQPNTEAGMHLLAHEAAHTVQQRGQEAAPGEHFHVTEGGDVEEEQAGHFADAVAGAGTAAPPRLTPSTRTGLLHRAISFAHASDAFTTNAVGADENAGGFRLGSTTAPSFQWDTDVTIQGVAGDPFANFQVGFLQVERVFGANVYWGSGANQTHRAVRPDAPLPRRDAAAAGSIFASDTAPYVRPAFAAAGDVRSPSFHDTPSTQRFPWANPIAGRVSNSGWFNYGDAFVTYLSARDTTAGTGAAAFRHLANVYWNESVAGRFDSTAVLGSRVTLSTPGAVNHSNVIEGASGEFPAMHGGTIANGHDTTTDT